MPDDDKEVKIYSLTKRLNIKGGEKISALLLSIFFLLLYLYTQTTSIYGGDAGDLVTAAYLRGVAHPPGYPLYTFIAWLLTKLPYFTISWRVGLLSSIPMALALGIFYLLINKLLRHRVISLICTFSYGFSYLIWLHGIIPEVFALHVFFVTLIFYIFLLYRDSGKAKFLLLASFVLGFSLTHHHTIILLVPMYICIGLPQFKRVIHKPKLLVLILFVFLLGLLPYIYVIWASKAIPAINWEEPHTIQGFFRLVSRAIYGTFRSGNAFGLNPIDRYYLLRLFFESIILDFNRLGIFLVIVGFVTHWIKDRKFFWVLLLGFISSGPLFIFYTGFPPVLNYYIGIIERFLLVPYMFLIIWMGYGIQSSVNILNKVIEVILHKKRIYSLVALFFLIPLNMLFINSQRLLPLKNDRTAENLAEDILSTVEDNGILLVIDDTSTFNTQYMYWTQGGKNKWRQIKYIQIGLSNQPFYINILNKYYPELELPVVVSTDSVFKILVEKNFTRFPIFSATRFKPPEEYVWVQTGFLNRLYKKSDLTQQLIQESLKRNEELFSSYHNPMYGALGVYMHVTLADVLRVYGNARLDAGRKLFELKEYELAEKYLRIAIELQPDQPDSKLQLGLVLMEKNSCLEAGSILRELEEFYKESSNVYLALSLYYERCQHDSINAIEYQKLYQEKLMKNKTKLDSF